MSEEGLFSPGTDEWKLPPELAVKHVETGGIFVVLDASADKFMRGVRLAEESGFFGAHVLCKECPRGVPYVRDSDANFGGKNSSLMCRPDRMVLVSEWLQPALEGVEVLKCVYPVGGLQTIRDIAASTEPTARELRGDVFTDLGPRPLPIATIRQHGAGFAGIVGAKVSSNDLVQEAPDNIKWLMQLIQLLTTEAAQMRRIRGEVVRPRWDGDSRPDHGSGGCS